jgi:hypothetical protein
MNKAGFVLNVMRAARNGHATGDLHSVSFELKKLAKDVKTYRTYKCVIKGEIDQTNSIFRMVKPLFPGNIHLNQSTQ